MGPVVYSLGGVFLVSLLSFVGLLFLAVQEKRLKNLLLLLVSFAAGSLLGNVFLHLIPKGGEKLNFSPLFFSLILAGLLVFFILEKFIHWRHCHVPTSPNHPHPLALINLVGDAFHNFLDGVMIGASFSTSLSLGWATLLAVILHEIPQEIGDFGVLLHGGFSKRRALFFNFVSALTAILGTLSVFFFDRFLPLSPWLIPFTAGGFLYIAGADLIPELHQETKPTRSLLQFLALLLGIILMAGL